jgi:hypothetical protein
MHFSQYAGCQCGNHIHDQSAFKTGEKYRQLGTVAITLLITATQAHRASRWRLSSLHRVDANDSSASQQSNGRICVSRRFCDFYLPTVDEERF